MDVIVTTGDLRTPYTVIGPVFFQVSNKGLFSSTLSDLKFKYRDELAGIKRERGSSPKKADWGFLWGEWGVGQNDFDSAFYVAVMELKDRAKRMGADAVIGMRQDIDIDTNGFSYFYLQMYGTAVRFVGDEAFVDGAEVGARRANAEWERIAHAYRLVVDSSSVNAVSLAKAISTIRGCGMEEAFGLAKADPCIALDRTSVEKAREASAQLDAIGAKWRIEERES